MSPWDGYVVADKDEPVDFQGFHVDGEKEVRIDAYNPISEDFEGLDATVSADTRVEVAGGRTLFPWAIDDVVIPELYWQPGCEGEYAIVRGHAPALSTHLLSARQDFISCWEGLEYDVEQLHACMSVNTPEIRIVTESYSPPPELHEYSRGPFRLTEDCKALTVHVTVDGLWDAVQVKLENNTNTWLLECNQTSSGPHELDCIIPFGGPNDIAADWPDLLAKRRAPGVFAYDPPKLYVRGLEGDACTQAMWTPWEGGLRFFIDPGSITDACEQPENPAPEPEPDDDPSGTLWDVTCICGDANVEIDLCLDASVSMPIVGAGIACGWVANDLGRRFGVRPTCVLDALAHDGSGPCVAGSWAYSGVAP